MRILPLAGVCHSQPGNNRVCNMQPSCWTSVWCQSNCPVPWARCRVSGGAILTLNFFFCILWHEHQQKNVLTSFPHYVALKISCTWLLINTITVAIVTTHGTMNVRHMHEYLHILFLFKPSAPACRAWFLEIVPVRTSVCMCVCVCVCVSAPEAINN